MTAGLLEARDSLKRFLQGAAAGALVAVIIGFTWGGWTLRSSESAPEASAAPSGPSH